ncbi:tetratricopeptide repeat protein [Stackebrandtia endophytica]|uniref:tetratricopeptide repeat protein n=1 Tax=Stackebrandtia endophytica TaxID=1496996 RepID=UPI00114F9872|nr:tetratricopeptide repeat protein [Stackebrandtia endophytica]
MLEVSTRWAQSVDPDAGIVVFRRGLVAEKKAGDFDAATALYLRAVQTEPYQFPWYRQFAEAVRVSAGIEAQLTAYDDAVKQGMGLPAMWDVLRASAYEASGRNEEAIAEYRRIIAMPGLRLGVAPWMYIAGACERLLDHPAGVRALQIAVREDGDDVSARRALAAALGGIGEWEEAEKHYRTLVDNGQPNLAVRYSWAINAEREYRTPFQLHTDLESSSTVPRDRSEGRAKEAFNTAVSLMHHLLDASPHRIRTAHRLGRLYEAAGMLQEAASAYTEGLRRLASIDEAWVHKAVIDWQFRLDYVKHQMSTSLSDDVRMARTVIPGPQPEHPHKVIGFYEGHLINRGLSISGFVLNRDVDSVELQIDGVRVKEVVVDARSWMPGFKFLITNDTLRLLNPQSQLTIGVGAERLQTQGGAEYLRLDVPDGEGGLFDRLSSGASISKKGVLSRSRSGADHRLRYLDVYGRVNRDFRDLTGRNLVLLYGTLLGCYRDGRFIDGDDDFDIGFMSDGTDPDSLKKDCLRIMLGLIDRGYDVSLALDGRMFKIHLDGMTLDVNPLWFFEDRVWGFQGHAITPDAIEPSIEMEFEGSVVHIPANSEALLADNYGPTWRKPEPGFRYYRSDHDLKVLQRGRLVPSEVRALRTRVAKVRRANPSAGDFVGFSDPEDLAFG